MKMVFLECKECGRKITQYELFCFPRIIRKVMLEQQLCFGCLKRKESKEASK